MLRELRSADFGLRGQRGFGSWGRYGRNLLMGLGDWGVLADGACHVRVDHESCERGTVRFSPGAGSVGGGDALVGKSGMLT